MKLISPSGVRISVDDTRGEKLLKQGYRSPDAPVPAPEKPARTRRKKADPEES